MEKHGKLTRVLHMEDEVEPKHYNQRETTAIQLETRKSNEQ